MTHDAYRIFTDFSDDSLRRHDGGEAAHMQVNLSNFEPNISQKKLLDKAESLEVIFLSQMLKSLGANKCPEGHSGGGIGEGQMSSMMSEMQAMQVAKFGGIGLAEAIFSSLVARPHG